MDKLWGMELHDILAISKSQLWKYISQLIQVTGSETPYLKVVLYQKRMQGSDTLKNKPTYNLTKESLCVCQIARTNSNISVPDLEWQLLEAFWKTFRACGLYSRRPLRVPELNRQNKIDWLNRYLQYQNRIIENWQNVIYSDKARVVLRSDDRRISVLRVPGRQAKLRANHRHIIIYNNCNGIIV